MSNITTQVANSSSFGERPIRVGGSSSFSRPAALIGGATALVALTAIATTLVVRPAAQHVGDPVAEARGAAVAAQSLLASSAATAPANNKFAGVVHDDKPAPNDGEEKPAPKAAAKPPVARPAARTERAQAPRHSGNVTDAASPATPERVAAAPCATCGVIQSVTPFKQKGEGSGIGAVAGGVLGGVVGHQVGGGNGKKAMTVLGAVGGGMAGHEIEKRQRSTTLYSVKVRMQDGTLRTVTQQTAPSVGQKVTLDGLQLSVRG